MLNLTPIPAYRSRNAGELVLLDPSRLSEWFGLENKQPKIVCKTTISGDFSAGWSLFIQENGSNTRLTGADFGSEDDTTPLDVIAILGHNLSIMSWQKLIFRCNSGLCDGLSYIALDG